MILKKKSVRVAGVNRKGYGQLIRSAREARELTQEELAQRIGTSPSTISNLEREQHPPTVPEQVNALVIALGITPETLLQAMGVRMTPPAATKLPRDLLETVLQLDADRLRVVLRLATALLFEPQHPYDADRPEPPRRTP